MRGPARSVSDQCYDHRMATATFSIAPVLTPLTVGALADSLERQQLSEKALFLRQLRPFVEGMVERCFAPLVQPTKKGLFANRFTRLARDFEAFRLYLNFRLFGALGTQDFLRLYEQTLLSALDPLMQTASAMEMRPELILATVHDYMRIMHALVQMAASPALQTNDPTVEQFTHTVNLLHAATRLDYGLTSVFLVLEMAIPRPSATDKNALLSALRKSLLEFGRTASKVLVHEHLSRVLQGLETPHIKIGRQRGHAKPPESKQSFIASSRRQTEVEWIARNKNLADTYGGQWVVIEKDELVANDPDYRRARDVAKQRGIRRPFIFFVPPKDSGGFMGL